MLWYVAKMCLLFLYSNIRLIKQVPVKETTNEKDRPTTFIKMPPEETLYLFVPVISSAPNVIKAHTSMFNPKETEGYYQLGNDSVTLISDMVARFQRKH